MSIKEIIAQMSLDEKVSLMSGQDFWSTAPIERLGVPSMFLADGPSGVRKQELSADHLGLNQSVKATCYPSSATMANTWNTPLMEQMTTQLGQEAAAQKVNVLLAPGINIKRNPLCGRNFEYFSEDPYLAGQMGAAFIRGVQASGISTCVKHFAANNQEERRMVIDTVVDERTLREIYLTGFEIAVKEGKAKAIMSAYNKLNGDYANENFHLLQEILRDEWGFNGVVVTDWGGNNDRVQALKAGNELEMPTTNGETNLEIANAIKSGKISESLLDEAVERLLTLIFDTQIKGEIKRIDSEVTHQMATRAAEESIVLLKNKDNILPLSQKNRLAVIGDFAACPRFQGAGSSVVNPIKIDTTLDIIGEYGFNFVGYEAGFKRYGKRSKALIKKAVRLAKNSDTILLYLGLDEQSETEGLDRASISLPTNQLELLAALKDTGKKIVVAIACGSVVDLSIVDIVDGLVHCYLGGEAGARATLNVLSGAANPSGRLSESYPYKYSDCSSANNFPAKQKTVEYREGLFVGYRYYDTANIPVRFPFGFGLSYTTFEYSGLKVADSGVVFTVTNTGRKAGAEVAQLYVGANNSKLFRPKKELKGFAKVMLQPGESKLVQIKFDEYTFRYFNVSTNLWQTEGCDYTVFIGSSVADIKLSGVVTKTGDGAELPYDAADLPSYYNGNAANVTADEFTELYKKALPDPSYNFIRKNRIKVDYNTAVSELKYARGWTGRLFTGGLRFVFKFLRAIGKRKSANVLMLGVYHMPLRGLSRMTGGAINFAQLDGIILMFNGHFFKGLSKFLSEGKKRKKLEKTAKKAKKVEAK